MKIVEIFKSIQGEGRDAGEVTTFVRTAGCNMRCVWCDTPYSWDKQGIKDATDMTLAQILDKVDELGARYVCLTGGEPLIQKDAQELISGLRLRGKNVSVFTNGSVPIRDYIGVSRWVVDYKLKSADAGLDFHEDNFSALTQRDDLKFVVGSDEDFAEAMKVIKNNKIKAKVLISPCLDGSMESAAKIAELIIKEKLNVRYSLQLHTVLWGRKRGV